MYMLKREILKDTFVKKLLRLTLVGIIIKYIKYYKNIIRVCIMIVQLQVDNK